MLGSPSRRLSSCLVALLARYVTAIHPYRGERVQFWRRENWALWGARLTLTGQRLRCRAATGERKQLCERWERACRVLTRVALLQPVRLGRETTAAAAAAGGTVRSHCFLHSNSPAFCTGVESSSRRTPSSRPPAGILSHFPLTMRVTENKSFFATYPLVLVNGKRR